MPLMIPDPGGEGAGGEESNFSTSPRVPVPCPVSLVPLHKNEGASGDVDENKGSEKFTSASSRNSPGEQQL